MSLGIEFQGVWWADQSVGEGPSLLGALPNKVFRYGFQPG